ncbi:MAG TPA: sigma-70 family RNA polymerase sigma factor [Pyrinomonadaceae bacterium]
MDPKEFELGFWLLFGSQTDGGDEYLHIWNELVFFFRDFSEPEELTDQVLDRMIRKAAQGGIEIRGSLLYYALTVARYVRLEYLKKTPVVIPTDLSQFERREQVDTSEREVRLQILDECLEELTPDQRELILEYYGPDNRGRKKIEQREKLAAELGMSIPSLRVRVHRIRSALANKIERKLRAIESSRIT